MCVRDTFSVCRNILLPSHEHRTQAAWMWDRRTNRSIRLASPVEMKHGFRCSSTNGSATSELKHRTNAPAYMLLLHEATYIVSIVRAGGEEEDRSNCAAID